MKVYYKVYALKGDELFEVNPFNYDGQSTGREFNSPEEAKEAIKNCTQVVFKDGTGMVRPKDGLQFTIFEFFSF